MVAFVFASDTVNLHKLVLTVVSVINFISTKVRRMFLSILRIQMFSAMENMLATFTSGPNAYIMSKFAVTVISIANFILTKVRQMIMSILGTQRFSVMANMLAISIASP
jgi:hypothetical protein